MKRIVWLVLMFLAGCGGGSTGSNSAAVTGTGTLALQVAQLPGDPAPKTVTALEALQPTRLRIVVSNREHGYRKILDVAVGESFEAITLPAAAGYKAELIYYKSGTPNQLSHYGVATDIAIISESTTSKAATMKPIQVPLALPESISPGLPYDVAEPSAESLNAFALQSQWSLTASSSPFTSRVHLAQPPSAVHTRLLPPHLGAGEGVFFQGEFFLKSELLDENEKWSDWVFVAESAAVPLKGGYISLDFGNLVETVKPVVLSVSVPGTKLPTGVIAPVDIVAADNGGIAGYMITGNETPPGPQDPGWTTSKPTSYRYAPAGGLVHGQDVPVTLYVWVKDYCGNVSEFTAASHATVVINDSPSVTSFAVPTAVFGPREISVSVTGKQFSDSQLYYQVSESPFPSDGDWVPGGERKDLAYNVRSITSQAPGQQYTVALYAWVKDAYGVSVLARNTVLISDAPQITSFAVLPTVDAGNRVTVTGLAARSADGTQPTHYLITRSSAKPAAADVSLPFGSEAKTFEYTGLAAGVPVAKMVYAWVKDAQNRVSMSKSATVRFLAP